MNHLNIHIQKLERDGETILADIATIINAYDRIALVGPNGIGKSTLMKIISGQIKDYDGNVENIGAITLGYLEQIHFMDEAKSVREELKDAFSEIREIEKSIETAEKILTETGDATAYTELLERLKNIGGYTYENILERVAHGIGIFDLLNKKLSEVSGGERTKIALAKILLSKPDFLLLDEPTNFIDLSSVEWLEKYLIETWKGGYLIVSHDREFLDETCEKVIEMRGKDGLEHYAGNYSFYVDEKKRREERAEKLYEEQALYIQSEKDLINRFRAGSRAGFAKSRERQLEKIEYKEKPETKTPVRFLFPFDKHGSETILKAEDAFIGRKDPLFYIREVTVTKGERIGIVGENGVGKSTFLKTILREIKPLEGYIHLHENTKILHFSQMHESLLGEKSIAENFESHGLLYTKERIGSIIGMYGFGFFDTEKKVKDLSGGERSRLLFAILGQKESNFLILDEPTNHLDYETREALETALRTYPGAVLFISHDRYFVNKLASKIWIIEDGELMISYGNYEDYRFKRERGITLDMALFDLDGEMNLVLEEKLGAVEARRIKEKFARKRRK